MIGNQLYIQQFSIMYQITIQRILNIVCQNWIIEKTEQVSRGLSSNSIEKKNRMLILKMLAQDHTPAPKDSSFGRRDLESAIAMNRKPNKWTSSDEIFQWAKNMRTVRRHACPYDK